MKVEIWSDIPCPWCYIGKRRFEKALSQFAHRDQVTIIWRSFQLDPSAPREYAGTINEMLAEKKGISRQQAEALHAQVTELAAQEGLAYHFERVQYGNSFEAHRLLHLAAEHHLQNEMKERLQKAYFTDGLSYNDPHTLIQLAVEVGLDADETRNMLETDAYAKAVHADIQRAQVLGIHGVPFFLFDERYAISGAQPPEQFLMAFERAWLDAHPIVELAGGGQEAALCDDESCII